MGLSQAKLGANPLAERLVFITAQELRAMSTLVADRRTADARLVQAAYALVAAPERMVELHDMLADRVRAQIGERGESPESGFESVTLDLQHALAPLETIDVPHRRPVDIGALLELNTPFLLIGVGGRVVEANAAAGKLLGLRQGSSLNEGLLDEETCLSVRQKVSSLKRSEEGILAIYEVSLEGPAAPPTRLALTPFKQNDGSLIGRITALSAPWMEELGRRFADALGLTAAEIGITKAVVTGVSLRQLAEKKNRSVETFRNQRKRLLSKLNTSSQTELVSLYSGFAQLSGEPVPDRVSFAESRPLRSRAYQQRGSGGRMAFDIFGQKRWKPVLFLHPTVGGTLLPSAVEAELKKRRLRLIMPWRPLFSETEDQGAYETRLERFADDIVLLLDSLGIAQCLLLFCNSATPCALTLAHRAPERFESIVGCAPVLPIGTRAALLGMGPGVMVAHFLARHAPQLLDLYIKGIMAQGDAGFEETLFEKVFEGSAADLRTVCDDEVRSIIFQAIGEIYRKGRKGVIADLRDGAGDWSHLLKPTGVKTTFLFGMEDQQTTPAIVDACREKLTHITTRELPGAGTLLLYQKPGLVLKHLLHISNVGRLQASI
jgi:pimeloyl-ACP methyl ester carboxylesterase/DNA-binding CsgD family transcriptional regulator